MSTLQMQQGAGRRGGWAGFKRDWLSDSATYPIILIISGAVTMLTLAGARQMRGNPDVRFDKYDRTQLMDDDDSVGEAHYKHFLRAHAADKNAARVSHLFNPFESKE